MSKSAILTAIYARVSIMTVANGFNFDWTQLKGDINGSKVSNDVQLHVEVGESTPLDSGVRQNQTYKVENEIRLFGVGSKDSSTAGEYSFDYEIYKAKLEEDIVRAMAFSTFSTVADFMDWEGSEEHEIEVTNAYIVTTMQVYKIRYWTDTVYMA